MDKLLLRTALRSLRFRVELVTARKRALQFGSSAAKMQARDDVIVQLWEMCMLISVYSYYKQRSRINFAMSLIKKRRGDYLLAGTVFLGVHFSHSNFSAAVSIKVRCRLRHCNVGVQQHSY